MTTVRVLKLVPGRKPEDVQIENSLDALQRSVGGYIEVVKIGERIDLIVNEHGAMLEALGTFSGHAIVGVALAVRKDDQGELVSLTDDDVGDVLASFVPARTLN
jgi:hypothetical protein